MSEDGLTLDDRLITLDLEKPIDLAFWYEKANRELGYEKYVLTDAQKSAEELDGNKVKIEPQEENQGKETKEEDKTD